MIRKNIKLEARLIDDLLDVTGIAQGRLKFHFTNLDLHPLIQDSLEALRADIDRKELKITLDLSAPEHELLKKVSALPRGLPHNTEMPTPAQA